ncbi:MAG TPA: carboxypeptidase-like regulatory domain-containing protein [Pyrinomonadaceae bacterium]|nr:carboxypeptidase-like regulatory domain-containing protein [Pyrinomonadaceae bacterium]
MRFKKLVSVLPLILLAIAVAHGQDNKSTGAIKGKVRVEVGTASDVSVIVREGDREVRRVSTDKNGDFLVSRLAPGRYGLTFRKTGLSVGTIEDIEVKPGKTRSLGDRLVLTIDEGSIAFIRGSVFSSEGRSVPNAKVELAKVMDDGTAKKIDGRLTTETGTFVFRLSPDLGKYRVSVKREGGEPIAKDVEIDGAAVYRVALSFPPKP